MSTTTAVADSRNGCRLCSLRRLRWVAAVSLLYSVLQCRENEVASVTDRRGARAGREGRDTVPSSDNTVFRIHLLLL
jgi:hypothetical protein